MPKDALDKALSQWERILAAAETNRKDLPYLEPCRAQLGADIEHVKALQERRTALREEGRQATRDLNALVARGRELVSRIQSGARVLYGPQGRKLEEFGIRLRRRKHGREWPALQHEAPRNPTTE